MKDIYIKYDPYEMITEFKMNDISITEMKHRHPWLDKVLNTYSMIPLQSWIDPVPSEKWDGLLAYLEKMEDDTFSISFCGRKNDFEDLKESLIGQNEAQGNILKLMFPQDKQQFIMSDSEMKAAIDDVVSIMAEDRFAAMVAGSENEDLKDKYASMQMNVSAITNKEFRVVFTGVYSSGKSTVINALIGKNILPNSEGTCTDKICYIKHSKEAIYSKVVYVLNGGQREEKVCDNAEETQEMIRNASRVEGVEQVDVYVDMSHLCPENLDDQFRLVFVDTPGTESEEGDDAGRKDENDTHLALTKKILSSDEKEMVVLVSDKKTVSSGITKILDIFEERAGEDHGCYNDRFLFVLNQCDAYNYRANQIDMMTGRYEGLENEVYKLKETVSKKSHGKKRRNIANPRIFPLTAAAALAIKIGCNDARNKPGRGTELRGYYDAYNSFCEKLTDHGAEYFVSGTIERSEVCPNYLLDNFSDLSNLQKRDLKEKYDHVEDINGYVLFHSGIISLEAAIRGYIEKYAFPIKMRKLLRAFKSILEEVTEENISYLQDLEIARNEVTDAKKIINHEKAAKDSDARRKKELEEAKEEMERILDGVGTIDTTLSEMNDIRSDFYKFQEESNSFFEKRSDGSLVRDITTEKAEEIRKKIRDKVNELANNAKHLVNQVANSKRKTADSYAEEFNKYLQMLKEKGLLNAGTFNIQNTVVYQDIIGDGGFMKFDSYARDVDNPEKEHIETDDGILNFIASIGRTITTIFEPSQVNRVDAIKYKETLFGSLDANVTKLISSVEASYKKDMEMMKRQMSHKMQAVLRLIAEIDEEIMKRKEKIQKDIETKEGYVRKKASLEADCKFLSNLIYKLNIIEQGEN